MDSVKILIVEDEVIIAMDIQSMLESLDYRVTGTAVSSAEALASIENEKPDIVLMDIMLQGRESGIEAARHIEHTLNIPVIFLTAHTDDATLEQAKSISPHGYITKPLQDIRELKGQIEIAVYKHRMEHELREKEENYRQIFNATGDAIFIHEPETRKIIDCNQIVESMLGYAKHEISGKTLADLGYSCPECDLGEIHDLFQKAVAKGPQTFEMQGCRKSGEKFWSEISIRYGKINGKDRILAVMRDITERKSTQLSLHEEEKKYRQIVEASPVGMHFYVLKAGERLEFSGANPAADRILGVENKQFIGKSIVEAFPDLKQTPIPGEYARVAKTGKSFEIKQVVYHRNGIQGIFDVYAFQTAPNEMAALFLDTGSSGKTA